MDMKEYSETMRKLDEIRLLTSRIEEPYRNQLLQRLNRIEEICDISLIESGEYPRI